MGAIVDVLSKIGDFFTSIFNFVLDFIKDIVYIAQLLADSVTKIPDYLSFLPPEVVAVFVSIFAIVIIYKLAGREG